MKTEKTLAALLAGLIILSLAGCAADNANDNTESGDPVSHGKRYHGNGNGQHFRADHREQPACGYGKHGQIYNRKRNG